MCYTRYTLNKHKEMLLTQQDIQMTKEYEIEWVTEVGLKAYIWKSPIYNIYCGYVDRSHVKKSLSHLDVHGGVTYEDELLVGFDCNHANDLPGPDENMEQCGYMLKYVPEATFKDIEFLKNQCEKLAKQVNDVYCGVLACMVV